MMRCPDFEKLIALEIEGDLGPRAGERLREHLRGCPSCREFVEGITASQSMLKQLRGEAVDDSTMVEVRRRVMERVGKGGPSWLYAWRWKYAYVLAAFGVLAGAVMLLRAPVEAPRRLVSTLLRPPPAPEVTSIEARAKPPAPRVPKRDIELPRIEFPRIEPARIDPPESPNQLVVKLLTDDPEIVIVWLIDQNGDRDGKAN